MKTFVFESIHGLVAIVNADFMEEAEELLLKRDPLLDMEKLHVVELATEKGVVHYYPE